MPKNETNPGTPFDGNASPRTRARRWPLPTGAALLLALIVVGLWPRPVPVESVAAERGSMRVTVDEEGQTRVRNRYVVSTPAGGHLRRIELKAGDRVEAGKTVLGVLETGGADLLDARGLAQARARVRGAESAREQAVARHAGAVAALEQARLEYERAKALAEQNTISHRERDIAVTNERVAEQEERAAAFGLQVAGFELEQTRAALLRGQSGPDGDAVTLKIVSPVSGRVLRVFQESARTVPTGMPLLEVGDATDLEVRIDVLSRDGVAIQPGARVLLEQWGGAKPLEARVRLVEPSAFTKISALGVEEQRVNVIADFVDPVEMRPTLGDGFRVEARIVRWEANDVLRVPAGALFQRDGEWQTFRIENDRARLRAVEVGRTNGIETEIVGGLEPGDRVIVYPGDRVADGSRVRGLDVEG